MLPCTSDTRHREKQNNGDEYCAWRVSSDKLPCWSGIVCGFCRHVIRVSEVWSQTIPGTMSLNNVQAGHVNPASPCLITHKDVQFSVMT